MIDLKADELDALLASEKCGRCEHRTLVHDDGHCCDQGCFVCACPEFMTQAAVANRTNREDGEVEAWDYYVRREQYVLKQRNLPPDQLTSTQSIGPDKVIRWDFFSDAGEAE